MPAPTAQRATARKKSIGADAPPKKFACQFDGCGRSFTRSEHLQRHLLNHTVGESTCERCRAHFKRKDLLERHMARHRQKDAEAGGGEGSGVLNTRKRMWKDTDGNIVTKRPNLGASATRPSPPKDLPELSPTSPDEVIHVLRGDAPISPPISSTRSSRSEASGHSSESYDTTTDPTLDTWIFPPLELSSPVQEHVVFPDAETVPQENDRFWSTAHGLATSSLRSTCEDVFQDDVFNPDTASSFNMPFTTMNNYNWLFDVDLSTHQQFSASPDILSGTFSATHVDQAPETRPSAHTFATGVPSEHTPTVPELTMMVDGERQPVMPEMSIGDQSTLQLPSLGQQQQQQQHPTFADGPQAVTADVTGRPSIAYGIPATNDETRIPRDPRLSVEFERPLSTTNRAASLPVIDEIARTQVLDLIDAAKPVTPDGFYVSRNHPLLSLSSLQTYCDLYFTRFNTAYPLLHQPTFDASHVETLLLVSVLLVGATYCEKDAHQMAVCIHDVLRPQIFAHAGFTAKPDLWVLQTILLVECFGKSRAGQKQHDMSHLFHGLLINLIRRSDCQTIRPPTSDDCTDDLEVDWRKWAEAEQKKRLAYLCFMWDVQHAVLFCQSLCMSAFELRSTLPCNQQLWEADSAEMWQRLRRKQKSPPLFLSLLKAYLTPGAPPSPTNLNSLSRVLLLHGLMSVSWDMKRRDQTSLGLVGNDSVLGNWKVRMGSSYDAWKADFDSFCLNYKALYTNDNNQRTQLLREFDAFATATSAVYHAAHVLLNAEFLDLQIYAGARHILGRPVTRPDYVRSQRVVKRWASSATTTAVNNTNSSNNANNDGGAAAKAAWHAAHILRDGSTNLQDFDALGLFHYPWTLYLATLTCWAFYHARPATTLGEQQQQASSSEDAPGEPDADADADADPDAEGEDADPDEDEIVWDAKAEMHALVSSMTSAGPAHLALLPGSRRRTSGLTAVVAKHLSRVRWAVVHDGMMVLRGLVPWRLISQYDCLG